MYSEDVLTLDEVDSHEILVKILEGITNSVVIDPHGKYAAKSYQRVKASGKVDETGYSIDLSANTSKIISTDGSEMISVVSYIDFNGHRYSLTLFNDEAEIFYYITIDKIA